MRESSSFVPSQSTMTTDMIWFANLGTVFLMKTTFVTLKFGIAEADDIASPDLVVLLDGRIGQIGVDQSTVGPRTYRQKHITKW